MIAFYRDVLGCQLERGPDASGLAQLRAGSALIDLVPSDADDHGSNLDHFCVQVVPWDAAAIAAHLTAHGVTPGDVTERYGATGFGPSIYFADPEGNVVELKG